MRVYRTPLRYPGGKQKLAPFLAELLQKNGLTGGHYAEAYAGGAGIALELLFAGQVSHIHLNDSWYPLYAFWYSALYKTEQLIDRISNTAITVEEWRRQKEVLARQWEFDRIDVAFSLLFLNRCNRSGIVHGAGVIGGLGQSGEWKIDARFPKAEIINRIVGLSQYRSSISLTNLDAEAFIRHHLPSLPQKSLIYFDPPYFHKADGLYYDHYTANDHQRIAHAIQHNVNRPWVISYDFTREVAGFYKNRRKFVYSLQYSAHSAYEGAELFVFSDDVDVPRTSSLSFIKSRSPLFR